MIEQLTKIGFRKVGDIILKEKDIHFKLFEEADSKNILYSFVVDGEPVYVGKTVQPLKRRMYGYKRPGRSQATNIRNNANLKKILQKGCIAELYALPDHGLLHFGVFHLSLAAGLEDSIVKQLSPKWNMVGK
ncbi:MAG: GIY-YIG nuclease family protein [Balneola sp.]